MPIVVHITDEKNAASIARAGIRPPRGMKAIYFMPVVQSHFISHQWIRELRRGGAKVLVGIYFRLPGTENVLGGGGFPESFDGCIFGMMIFLVI